MDQFEGKIAVVTGGGSGMGQGLARQLTAEGCHVAICDVSAESMAETVALCEQAMPPGTRVTTRVVDVTDEAEVLAWRDAVQAELETESINLLFNNAGIGGGGSFLVDEREEWERTFAVCWNGVYHCARAFLPMLVASDEGHIINTSSVNGFWASLGPAVPHTAYSAAKFAVKGFTEALINDLRINAPHVRASVVMPGHIGTGIAANSRRVLGQPEPMDLTAEQVEVERRRMRQRGFPVDDLSDDGIRAALVQRATDFRENAPLSGDEAAGIILDGVRAERWRILVGEDARILDESVREQPEDAYEPLFMQRLQDRGVFGGIVRRVED